jgi:hypothetical protein
MTLTLSRQAWCPGSALAPAEDFLAPVLSRERLVRIGQDPAARRADLEAVRLRPWYWLVNHVVTLDEDDRQAPYKRFPAHPFLRRLADLWWWTAYDWREVPRVPGRAHPSDYARQPWPGLLLPKSRKQHVTWLMASLFFGECQFVPGRRNTVQSYKLLEAEAIVEKMKGVWQRQPPWIRQPCEWTTREARFANDSVFLAVPGGAEQLQGPTLSGYFCNEAGDLEEPRETFEAALPAVGHGRYVAEGRCPRSWWFDVLLADKLGDVA